MSDREKNDGKPIQVSVEPAIRMPEHKAVKKDRKIKVIQEEGLPEKEETMRPKKMNKWRGCMILILGLALSSCGPKRLVNNLNSFGEKGWHLDSLVQIDFHVDDTLKGYDFYLLCRNTGSYKYRNMYAILDYQFPDRNVSDTISFYLSDPLGHWLGSGIGGSYSNEILFKKNARFPRTGNYSIRIRHGMRDTLLQGITDFGLEIEPTED